MPFFLPSRKTAKGGCCSPGAQPGAAQARRRHAEPSRARARAGSVATQIAYDTSNASPRNAASPLPGTTKLWNMPSQFYVRDYAVNGVRAPPGPPARCMPRARALCGSSHGPCTAGMPQPGSAFCHGWQDVRGRLQRSAAGPVQAASCALRQAVAGLLMHCNEVLHVSAPAEGAWKRLRHVLTRAQQASASMRVTRSARAQRTGSAPGAKHCARPLKALPCSPPDAGAHKAQASAERLLHQL